MAAQDSSTSRAATGIVLQVADKQHTISGAQLARYPDSLLSRLATADLEGSSNAKVLQLDSMGRTPLAYWPESAAPLICSLYRWVHLSTCKQHWLCCISCSRRVLPPVSVLAACSCMH
jgi:hypothetical protein